jgi:eukaryotic-like serine/threonine-protein kinase
VTAYREPPRLKLRRWTKRHRTLVTSAVVLMAASVVGLAIGLWAVNAEKNKTRFERDRAWLAEEEAEANLAKARENLKLARTAIDECCNVCKNDPMFQEPRTEKAKKLLLRKTLPSYKRFREARRDDGESQETQEAYQQARR